MLRAPKSKTTSSFKTQLSKFPFYIVQKPAIFKFLQSLQILANLKLKSCKVFDEFSPKPRIISKPYLDDGAVIKFYCVQDSSIVKGVFPLGL